MAQLLIALLLALFLAACAAPAQPVLENTATSGPPTPRPTSTRTATPTPVPTTSADAFAFEQNRRLGRGVNLGNALEAPVEGEWGMVLEEEFFTIIKEGGFDSIRVPIRWSAHAQEEPPYTVDEVFFERIDWVLEQAQKNDLYVVINMHHYDGLMETPRLHRERFVAIWQQIARRYRDQPDSVLFEFMNEPNGMLSATNDWNALAAETLREVRKTNPNRTVVIGPGEWNNLASLPVLQLPEEDRNIIVTFHDYSPFQFTHQGAEWADGSEAWLGTTWEGTEAQQTAVQADMDKALAWGNTHRRPIYMGEFGAYSRADTESRQRWTSYMARQAEQRGISWAYWEFGAGFGVYDREAKTWNEPIYKALIP